MAIIHYEHVNVLQLVWKKKLNILIIDIFYIFLEKLRAFLIVILFIIVSHYH